ncbi:MAG: DUF502 domain-containing protein [Spirosomataceae bacterium]
MSKILQTLFGYFIRGLLVVAPIGLTLFILYTAFDFVDSLIQIPFSGETTTQPFFIPGLGFLIVISGISAIGFVFSTLIPNTIQNWLENTIKNLPIVKIFYTAFQDLTSAFVGDKRKFQQPVVITLNKEAGIQLFGFITQADLASFQLPGKVAVYCPHSYALSGVMYVVPKESIQLIHRPSAEVMKLIISGGVSIDNLETNL